MHSVCATRLAVASSRQARSCVGRLVSTTAAGAEPTKKHGLGIGNIRSGLGAIHRVKIKAPAFISCPRTVSVIGAPMTFGQPFAGTDEGPKALRDAGLYESLLKMGWRLHDHGDLQFDPPTQSDSEYEGEGLCLLPYSVGRGNKKIKDAVFSAASQGHFSLVLGGDHSIGLGSLAGVLSARPDTGVVWVDAHADLNTPATSPSGNMHGMPLAFLLGLIDINEIPGHSWLEKVPRLEPEQLTYIALRDVDRGERHFIEKMGIKAFTMFHVDKYGIGKVMEMALDHLDGRPLHLSYDIDACDPVIAPATGTEVRGGLNYREAHYVAEAVWETQQLGSMDIVEVNPALQDTGSDDSDVTVDLGLALITSALGNRIL